MTYKPKRKRKPASMLCPVCDVDLVMSERKGIEIDYCPECRGVWLDRGELDKIIDRSDYKRHKRHKYDPEYRTSYRGNGYEGSYRKKDYYKKRRRKSVVDEIFDLFD